MPDERDRRPRSGPHRPATHGGGTVEREHADGISGVYENPLEELKQRARRTQKSTESSELRLAELETDVGRLASDLANIRKEMQGMQSTVATLENGIDEILTATRNDQKARLDKLEAAAIERAEAEKLREKRAKEEREESAKQAQVEREEKRKDRQQRVTLAVSLITVVLAGAGTIIAATRGNPPSVVVQKPVVVPEPVAVPVPTPVPASTGDVP